MDRIDFDWDMDEPLTFYKTYPKNSMIPAITKGTNKKDMVSMVMIADREIMEMLNEMAEDNFDIQTTTYAEDVKEGENKNLVVRFDMFLPNAHTTYEGVIHNVNGQQKDFVETLRGSELIDLYVTNEGGKVEKVIPVKWEYERAKKVLDNFK